MHGPPGDFPRRELWIEARESLQGRDPVLDKCMAFVKGDPRVRIIEDPFAALVSAFCHIQVSAIQGERNWEELLAQNNSKLPTPDDIIEMNDGQLRKAISVGKRREYLRDIAIRVLEDPDWLEGLPAISNNDVVARLCGAKGIGEWVAGWMLMYHLARPNIVLKGDASLNRSVRLVYGMDHSPHYDELLELAKGWGEHASAACWFIFMAAEAGMADSAQTSLEVV